MSHIVRIRTRVTDPVALSAACRRLGLPEPTYGIATLFAGQQATGWAVSLPGWTYPVVADVATGGVQYDNYNQAWGKQVELDKLLQAYACEKARLEARRAGQDVREQTLTDGSIKLTISVGTHTGNGGGH